MHRLIKNRTKKTGFAPGALVSTAEPLSHHIHLSMIEYTENSYTEKEDVSLQECLDYIETPSMTWVQVYGAYDPSTVALIGHHFKLHALVMEDILNPVQRPKIDTYEDQVFIITRLLDYQKNQQQLHDEQVSIVFGPHFLISFLESDRDVFLPIKERLRQANNRIRKEGADYLAYALLDMIVDYYFIVLEKMDSHLDHLEKEVSNSPKSNILRDVQQTKRNMIFLRKSIWPMRDVINHFQRLEPPYVTPHTQIFLRDLYDHIVQIIDIIEGFRDIVAGMMDIYLSNINIRTNDIMKVLTIVSTVFVPLTFLSSLYGMNFDYMPELHKPWGYPLVLLLMTLIAMTMLLYFHRKKWF